jgi:drug/metabolite transporter (DMT)-like permease
VKTEQKIKGGLHYMLGAAFFFSLMSLLVKIAGQRLPVAEIVFARSAVMLVISCFLVRQLISAKKNDGTGLSMWGNRKSLLILRGLVGFAALFCFFYAVTKLPLADITVIHFTNPVFTAIFAALFLGESMGRREVAGLALSLVGVALVAQPSFLFGEGARNLDLFAVIVALCAAILSSMAYTTVRKLRETDHHLVVVFYFRTSSRARGPGDVVQLYPGSFCRDLGGRRFRGFSKSYQHRGCSSDFWGYAPGRQKSLSANGSLSRGRHREIAVNPLL